jgi:hypothetical protein
VTSPEFDELNDAKKIRARVSDELDLWNGLAALDFGCGPIRVLQVNFVSERGQQQATAHFKLVVHGLEFDEGDDHTRQWASEAKKDPTVRKVFDLISQNGLDNWVNLYRIFELIRADWGGEKKIASRGWTSETALELFRRTANDPTAAGLEARHGKLNTEPPRNPMPLSEAKSLIIGIARSWLKALR